MEITLEIALVVLLVATLVHAVKLERALGVLRRDRTALQELVDGFNASTRAAEQGIERLHAAADGAGRTIARQTDLATRLKDDLVFLIERGERVADQLDALVRSGRAAVDPIRKDAPIASSGAVRQLDSAVEPPGEQHAAQTAGTPPDIRVRSQAERDLLNALRLAR